MSNARDEINRGNEAFERFASNTRLRSPESTESEIKKILDEELARLGIHRPSRSENGPALSPEQRMLQIRIHDAAATFVSAHPVTDPANPFLPNEANEQRMLDWIFANGMDGTAVYHYELAFAELRNSLDQPTSAKRRPRTPARQRLTREEIDGWSLTKYERELRIRPDEIEAVLRAGK